MKSTLIIKDLALDKELGGKAMSAVRGGSAVNQSFAPQTINFGGKVSQSPVTIVGPITTQTAVDLSSFEPLKGFKMPSYNDYSA
jgi:hypothetical protein